MGYMVAWRCFRGAHRWLAPFVAVQAVWSSFLWRSSRIRYTGVSDVRRRDGSLRFPGTFADPSSSSKLHYSSDYRLGRVKIRLTWRRLGDQRILGCSSIG